MWILDWCCFILGEATDPNTTGKTSCCPVLLAVRQKTNFHGKDSSIAYHFITSILVMTWCKIIKTVYSWRCDHLHWFRVTFTCESKMTKAGIDLVKQSQWQVHIFCVSLTGPDVNFAFTSIALEIRMHECTLRAYINGPRKGHIWYPAVFIWALCWWIGAVLACFLTTIPSCAGYFQRLVCSRFFCLHG